MFQAWIEVFHKIFGWLKRANHITFTEECVMDTEKYVLVKKMFYKCSKHGIASMSLSGKKQVIEWKHTNSLVKKRFWVQLLVKKALTNSLLRHERTHHFWFSWKSFNCIECFHLPTPAAKFTLFIKYAYIYIYIYI